MQSMKLISTGRTRFRWRHVDDSVAALNSIDPRRAVSGRRWENLEALGRGGFKAHMASELSCHGAESKAGVDSR
jgi:hypothetical protein